jgi:predicted DCC family thiol-disulfide oxidoreductase YuxK
MKNRASGWADFFWSATRQPGRTLFSDPHSEWQRCQPLVRGFYAILLYFGCSNFYTSVERYNSLTLDPLWPLAWIHFVPTLPGIHFVLLLFVFGPLAAAWNPQSVFFRGLAFLGCLEGMALDNSFGKINGHLHLWTVVAFFFLFLPSAKQLNQVTGPLTAVRLFWGAQTFVLLTYSMSGISKILGMMLQLSRHQYHTFLSHDGLARFIADRLMQTGERSLFGPWLIDHPWVGWPLHLGAIYLETFAFVIAFRPALQRSWVLGLVLMHIGIFLTMNVTFATSILILALLFASSPLAPGPFISKQAIRDLPWFGPLLSTLMDVFSRQKSEAAIVVFYDGTCGICNQWVAFLLRRPLPESIRFAAIQGPYYQALAQKYPTLSSIDSIVHYRRDGETESLRIRSEGVLWMLSQIPGWTRLAVLVLVFPVPLLDIGYRIIARVRHRLGRNLACIIPTAEQRQRFLLESPQ